MVHSVHANLQAPSILSGVYNSKVNVNPHLPYWWFPLVFSLDCALSIYIMRERKMFYLTTHSTHFIYGYMASDIWLRTILIVREETRCRHMGYSYWLTARVLLYAPSHRQDNTYHGLCYTSRGALAGTRLYILCTSFINNCAKYNNYK